MSSAATVLVQAATEAQRGSPQCLKRASDQEQERQLGFVHSSATAETRAPQLLVQILLDDGAGGARTSIPVAGEDTVRELKLQLAREKGWFTSKHCLFFGDRELLDHQHVADIMSAVQSSGNSRYLHVFVRTSDVRAGQLQMGSQSLSFGNLPDLADDEPIDPCALPERGSSADLVAIAPPEATPAAVGTVIHVVIRKTAHVTWQPNAEGAFELLVQASDTAADVKQALLPAGAPGGPRILEDVALVHRGVCMDADRPLIEYGLANGAEVELVPWRPTLAREPHADGPAPPDLASPAHDLYVNWQKAASGLRAGIAPDLAPTGTGGSYFLRDTSRNIVAVFKPADEEGGASNNPRGFRGTPAGSPATGSDGAMRRGIRPGEGALREIAAYLLDHGHRAGVPATAPVYIKGARDLSAKYGSLQQYVHADTDCEELGYGALDVAEVHKIAVLDVRLANADRNGSNILARRASDGRYVLTPIDHGCCLPDAWEDMSFEWSNWRQARVPFDEDTTAFIAGLDPDRDLALLRQRGIRLRPASERIFKAANMVLKKVAAAGLPVKAAADVLERQTLRKSTMEKMHRVACERGVREEEASDAGRSALVPLSRGSSTTVTPRSSLSGAGGPVSDAVYLRHLSALLDEYLLDIASEDVLT